MHLGVLPFVPRALSTTVVCSFALLLLSQARGADSTAVDQLKLDADRWIDLEKRAADERNEWRTQKEVLVASIDVLKKERAALQAKVEANDFAAGLFRTRVENSRNELAANETAQTALTESCAALEKRLRALTARLPDPLQERIRPLLEKLQQSSASEPLAVSDRTQLLVTALTAIDQFNNSLTLTHHLRPNGSGDTLDVKVLYWGLAAGYGVDATGEHAWLLTPGASGWEWSDATAHVADIATLISIYEKQGKPALIVLPVAKEGGAR